MNRLALLAAILALAAVGCSGGKKAELQQRSSGAASVSQHLTDLRNIGQLRSLFNTRSHEPRLILLVSPT